MNFEDLKNPELQEKLMAAKTPEELLAIAKEAGFSLSDDALEAVAGGDNGWCSILCTDNSCGKDHTFCGARKL